MYIIYYDVIDPIVNKAFVILAFRSLPCSLVMYCLFSFLFFYSCFSLFRQLLSAIFSFFVKKVLNSFVFFICFLFIWYLIQKARLWLVFKKIFCSNSWLKLPNSDHKTNTFVPTISLTLSSFIRYINLYRLMSLPLTSGQGIFVVRDSSEGWRLYQKFYSSILNWTYLASIRLLVIADSYSRWTKWKNSSSGVAFALWIMTSRPWRLGGGRCRISFADLFYVPSQSLKAEKNV